MRICAVINYKGGVGKTSLTANLGADLASRGYRVLLVDLDPQTSLTFSFLPLPYWHETLSRERTIKRWFDMMDAAEPPSVESLVCTPSRVNELFIFPGRLDLIASHLALINVDLDLATRLSGSSFDQARRNYLKVHRHLAAALEQLPRNRYDLVLIDCPPNFNLVTKTAIAAADSILIPARPDYLSTLAIGYLKKSVDSLVADYNRFARAEGEPRTQPIDPRVLGVVFTMVQEFREQPIREQLRYIEGVRQMFAGVPVFDAHVKRNDTLFAAAPERLLPVVLERASGESHQDVIAGLRAVSLEFEQRLGLARRASVMQAG